MLKGKIIHEGEASFLIIEVEGQEVKIKVQKLQAETYEVIDDGIMITVEGLILDIVIAKDDTVIYYCESIGSAEVDEVLIN